VKIFAHENFRGGITLEQAKHMLKEECKAVWKLYKQDVLREIYYFQGKPGAMIVLECESVEAAQAIVSELPIVKGGYCEFEFFPVIPFAGYESLFAEA
jgi:hypothetical protein